MVFFSKESVLEESCMEMNGALYIAVGRVVDGQKKPDSRSGTLGAVFVVAPFALVVPV
jgi:hypothetical protein